MPPRLLLVGGDTAASALHLAAHHLAAHHLAAHHLAALEALAGEGLVDVVVADPDGDWQAAVAGADAVVACAGRAEVDGRIAAAARAERRHLLWAGLPAGTEEPAGPDGAGLITMVAWHRRFRPLYRRAMAASLDLGNPTTYYARTGSRDLVAALDLAAATIGPPTSFSVARSPAGPWTAHLHGAGGTALLAVDPSDPEADEGPVEWAGAGYDVTLVGGTSATWAQTRRRAETWTADPEEPPAVTDGWVDLYRAFLSAVAGEAVPPSCDLRWAAWLAALADALATVASGTMTAAPPLPSEPAPAFDPAAAGGRSDEAGPAGREAGPADEAAAGDEATAERWLGLVLAALRLLPETQEAMRLGGWPRPGQPVGGGGGGSWKATARNLARRLPLSQANKVRLVTLERRLRGGRDPGPAPAIPRVRPVPSDLRGLVVGLVGWDATGACFTRLLVPFACDILVGGAPRDDAVEDAGAQRASPGEVLGASSVIVLTAAIPVHGRLGDRQLAQIRPGTVVLAADGQQAADPDALARRLAVGDLRPADRLR